MEQTGGVTQFLPGVRIGDPDAVGEVARQYLPRVVRLLERKLRGLRAADAENVAGSVFLALWNHAGGGRFGAGTLSDSEDLWRWLLRVTDRKAIDYARREKAAKRGGGRTRGAGDVFSAEGPSDGLDGAASVELSPADLAAFADTFERLMASLPNDLTREVVVGRLESRTSGEIARALGVSPKTVKRKLSGIRDLIRSGVIDGLAPPTARRGSGDDVPEDADD
ncbi:RNA polymerase sigma factor [Alienimonas californiensis]|uniref:RNA polymerase sigma factor n=1 Tax=Alienimonas californiensis TaxID=2527989 RepID=A0A517PEI9_9PLAN|nr:RNA polymerase sigma factor [Alienimonas californiensis]